MRSFDDFAEIRLQDAAQREPWPEAPGLEVADLDELAKRHYARGRADGFELGFRQGQEQGLRSGRALALREVGQAVSEIVNRRLIHIERRMRDRQERQRSTIKAERAFMLEQAAELDVSVRKLREIASTS